MATTAVTLNDRKLIRSLQLAYSAERAAAFAYIGHANALSDPDEVAMTRQIERDEWEHRDHVRNIMDRYEIPVSRWYEIKYWWIGKFIALSCYLIGWFMPHYFAGRLESGNVCEYFVMIHRFRVLGITEHDPILYEMGVKEKEHEDFFAKVIEKSWLMPIFEFVFRWGPRKSYNDLPSNLPPPEVDEAGKYCTLYPGAPDQSS